MAVELPSIQARKDEGHLISWFMLTLKLRTSWITCAARGIHEPAAVNTLSHLWVGFKGAPKAQTLRELLQIETPTRVHECEIARPDQMKSRGEKGCLI